MNSPIGLAFISGAIAASLLAGCAPLPAETLEQPSQTMDVREQARMLAISACDEWIDFRANTARDANYIPSLHRLLTERIVPELGDADRLDIGWRDLWAQAAAVEVNAFGWKPDSSGQGNETMTIMNQEQEFLDQCSQFG